VDSNAHGLLFVHDAALKSLASVPTRGAGVGVAVHQKRGLGRVKQHGQMNRFGGFGLSAFETRNRNDQIDLPP
jgi:hypothetical protein